MERLNEVETEIKISNEDAEAYFVLLAACLEIEDNYLNIWDKFEKDIIYNNRFFPDSEILNEIEKNSEAATIFLPKGKELYRARIFDKNPNVKFLEMYKNVLAENGIDFEAIKNELISSNSMLNLAISLLQFTDEKLVTDDDLKFKLEALRRYRATKFKGYNAKDSLPPKDNIPSGRANPNQIRYLYLCEDSETPIYEIKPTIKQSVSLAKLKLNREVKLYDFTSNDRGRGIGLFFVIGDKFSMPNFGDPITYLPTQYIAEKIKKMGFDGIRFNSSLNRNGKNIVLFNVDDCTVVSSKLLEVTDITIKTKIPDIYDDVENLKSEVK